MNLQKQLQYWGMDIPKISEKMRSGLSSDMNLDKETIRAFLVQTLTAESHRYDTYDSLAVKLLIEEHEEKTPDDYIEVVSRLQQNRDLNGDIRPLLEKGFYEFILHNQEIIRSIFKNVQKTSPAFHLSVFGWKTLLRSYLMRNHEGVVERPDHLWFRVALFIHKDNWENVERTFRFLRQGYFIHATPTLFSAGTIKSQMASCFVSGTRVLTDKGWIPIEKVQIGQLTRSHQGIWQKIVQLHKNPLEKRILYSLSIGSSSSVVVTDNHPFYVYERGNCVWKSVDRLEEGDWIISKKKKHFDRAAGEHQKKGLLWAAAAMDTSWNLFVKKDDYAHARRLLRKTNYKILNNFSNSNYIHIEISPSEMNIIPPRSVLLNYRDEDTDAFISFLRGIQMTSRWKSSGEECTIRLRKDHYYFSLVYDLYDIMQIHKMSCNVYENNGYHELNFKMPVDVFSLQKTWNKYWYEKTVGNLVLAKLRSKVVVPSEDTEYVYTLGVEHDHSYTVEDIVVKNCFLVGTDDSVEGIYRTISDCAQISKWAGGLGIHISNIRGKNAYIYGTNGTSNGIMPMLKVYNDTARYIDQCFSGETKIFTDRGLIPIREIRPYTDRVLTKNGRFEKVLKKLVYTKNGNDHDIVSVTTRTPWETTESVLMMGSHHMMMKNANQEMNMIPFISSGFLSETCYYPLQDLVRVDWTENHCRALGYIYRHMQKINDFSFSLLLPPNAVLSDIIIHFFKEYYPLHFKKHFSDNTIIIDFEHSTINRPHSIDLDKIGDIENREIPSMFLFMTPISKTRSFLEGWYGESFNRSEHFYYKYRELFKKQGIVHGRITGVYRSNIDNKNHHFYDLEIENEHNYHTVLGLAHNGGGKRNGAFACFVKDTKVLTINEGVKNIQDIKIGDQVVTHKNRVRSVTQLHKNLLDNRKIYKVSIVGNKDIFVTGNHKFWSFYSNKSKKNNEGWNSIEDLKMIMDNNKRTTRQNCYVCIPNGTGIEYHQESMNIMDYKDILLDDLLVDIKEIDNNKVISVSNGINSRGCVTTSLGNAVNKSWIINEDLAKIFGIWLGDGCIKKSNDRINGIRFTVHNKNEKLIHYIINTCTNIFGCKVSLSKKLNVANIDVNSRIIGKMFNHLFGSGKSLPSKMFSWSKNLIHHLLAGLITVDGHVTKNKMNITLSLSNVLMTQIFHLCRNNGIKVSYLNHKSGMISIAKSQEIIDNIYDDNRMEKCIQMFDRFLKIQSITETDRNDEYVYTLGVEEDHSYTVEGGIIVENCYLEPWHSDIFEFLEAKRNIGNEEDRARDLFYALWIPDLFMEKVEKGEDWFLMCPRQSPGLEKVWGDEFKQLYEEYVATNRFVRKVPARELWREMLRSQIETGTPYMLYKDTCNRHSNQQNIGTIRSSNLCCEIIQFSDHTEYAVCNLASIALPKCVITRKVDSHLKIYGTSSCIYCKLLTNILKDRRISFQYMDVKECPDTVRSKMKTVPIVMNGDVLIGGFQETWEQLLSPVFDFERLGQIVETLVENLNIVIDKNDYPIDKCRKSNLRHRPMGIGVQGLADVFFMLMLPYDSPQAKTLNQRIFETMYYHAIKKSCLMAKELGVYDSFEGSPLSKGKFHFELYPPDVSVSTTMDWESLKKEVMTFGVRNSLFIAPMPTASTSQILGNTESFEPLTSNLYLRRTSAGEFYVCNPYLRKLLMMMNLWDDDMLDMMIVYKGSIQKIDKIPVFLKNIFRTVWEIPQKSLLQMASERQWFIDQSQSMNVYLTDPDLEKLTKIHFYGWKKLLKTGSYYVRARASNSSQNFTIDPKKERDMLCVSCTA